MSVPGETREPGRTADGRAAPRADDGGEAPARIERVLRRHEARPSPWSGDLGEPDRRAAVVLVLRPASPPAPVEPGAGDRPPRGPGDEDDAGPPGRARADDAPGAPLFDRPLVPELRGVEALFIVRAEREGDPWSGQVGLPGGHAEAVDADLLGAGLRELREETGLELARADVLGRLDQIRPRSRRLPSVEVAPFVAWHAGDASVDPGREVAGHFWLSLPALESPRHRTVLTFRRDGALRVFPGVGHEQGVVWGLTWAVVRRFLSLLPREGRWPTR